MTCSTKGCLNKANPELTDCGHTDFMCDCQLYPICDECMDREQQGHYEFMEIMSHPGFNAFYLAHLPQDDYDDGFYRFWLESLVRTEKTGG